MTVGTWGTSSAAAVRRHGHEGRRQPMARSRTRPRSNSARVKAKMPNTSCPVGLVVSMPQVYTPFTNPTTGWRKQSILSGFQVTSAALARRRSKCLGKASPVGSAAATGVLAQALAAGILCGGAVEGVQDRQRQPELDRVIGIQTLPTEAGPLQRCPAGQPVERRNEVPDKVLVAPA